MKSRIVTIFYDGGDLSLLRHSFDTFLVMNNAKLSEFKLVVYLYRPSHETVETVKHLYAHRTPYLTAGATLPCIPCILKRHRVRYGIVIPPGYRSIAPIWPYLDEIKHNLKEIPALTHIQLTPDTDLSNKTTHKALVYRYNTANIMIGNGNMHRDVPVLTKAKLDQTPSSVSGVLKPIIFRKESLY